MYLHRVLLVFDLNQTHFVDATRQSHIEMCMGPQATGCLASSANLCVLKGLYEGSCLFRVPTIQSDGVVELRFHGMVIFGVW